MSSSTTDTATFSIGSSHVGRRKEGGSKQGSVKADSLWFTEAYSQARVSDRHRAELK